MNALFANQIICYRRLQVTTPNNAISATQFRLKGPNRNKNVTELMNCDHIIY